MSIPVNPPSGFRDFLPEACARREFAVRVISEVYRSFGFEPIATSAVEDLAVLTGKGGGENEKLIFKILKRGDKLEAARAANGELSDLGLRFDLTLPLSRFYAKHQSRLPHPFKAFHIGPVWRAERAQKGRYREFYQCDADIIGSESPLCEVEVISAILTAFERMGFADATVHLNDRALVYAALAQAGAPESQRGQACIALDKLDKTPRESVEAELLGLLGAEPVAALQKTLMADAAGAAADLSAYEAAGPQSYQRLAWIAKELAASGWTHVRVNPSLMRGLDYYTGPVFEFRHAKLSGSLGGGGRYDRLSEKFGGPAVPACGASIGFERLLLLLEESGAGAASAGPEFCVLVFDESLREKSLELARRLRAAGKTADLYPGTGKLKAQFKYADAKRAAHALIIGPDEAAAGLVKAKNLKTGEERLVKAEELVEKYPSQ
ncbi:MAG: histidine--tRNA ligase [Elusimicrobia bacterium]|nr:histidine--tRNA ligase [Elusimicrobiota bacterium]